MISDDRNSETLQLKRATEVSSGKNTRSQIQESYLYFGFEKNRIYDEQYILGTYYSRLEDAPGQAQQMREALRIIGSNLKSQKIMDVADDCKRIKTRRAESPV